jgi:hypothetical protein
MNAFKFAIARAYAQLLAASKTRQLTKKEQERFAVLEASVKRYKREEAEEARTVASAKDAAA